MKTTAFEEIICSFPEYDPDNESWHMTYLWGYFTPKRIRYTTCDTDGNHEPCSAKVADEIIRTSSEAHLNYAKWVVAHKGHDPCGEFPLKRKTKVKRNIVATFTQWVGCKEYGFAFDSLRMGQRVIRKADNIPTQIREFLEITRTGGRWVAPWCTSYEAAREYCINAGYVGQTGSREGKCGVYVKATAEWEEPRQDHLIRRDIVKKAKAYIKRKEA